MYKSLNKGNVRVAEGKVMLSLLKSGYTLEELIQEDALDVIGTVLKSYMNKNKDTIKSSIEKIRRQNADLMRLVDDIEKSLSAI